MVDVRVAQHRRVHLPRVKREMAVPLQHLVPVPLKQPAFQQKAFSIHLQQIHRTRRRARGPKKWMIMQQGC